jgi:hypothetical protein
MKGNPMKSLTLILTLALLLCIAGSAQAGSVLDFDGDGRTDYAVVRNQSDQLFWYIQQSTLGFRALQFGIVGDRAVPADYDGDNKWDIAVWRPGIPSYFYILRSQTNSFQAIAWGSEEDDPYQTQDFDGDGLADPTIVRVNPADGMYTWYTLGSVMGSRATLFGEGDDLNLRGDFDGDGKADIAIYTQRMAFDCFVILYSSNNSVNYVFFGSRATDVAVPADFDFDGKTDVAVWRGSTTAADAGTWYWRRSSDGGFQSYVFGLNLNVDLPVPGNYSGPGATNMAVWRRGAPSIFHVLQGGQNFSQMPFGNNGDTVLAYTLQARF